MNQYELTFVGGPEDGKRIMTRLAGDTYRVALMPPLPMMPVHTDVPAEVTMEQFVYRIMPMPGQKHVAYPVSWNDDHNHSPTELVVAALMRGYVGQGHR